MLKCSTINPIGDTSADIFGGVAQHSLESPLNQHRGIGRDALFTTGEAELLGRGGLDGNIFFVDAHDIGQGLLHKGNMGLQLGTLGTHRGIDIAHAVALGGDELYRTAKEYLAVDILELARIVGKVVTDIAHVGCTQECITDSMDEHIGIRVAKEASVMFKTNAAEP